MSRLTDLLFPPKCAGCGELLDFTALEDDTALCRDCLKLFEAEERDLCGHCFCEVRRCTCMTELLENAKCGGLFKLVYYRHGKNSAVQNRVIFRIKNKRDARTPRFLAARLAENLQIRTIKGDISLQNAVICYVPRRRSVLLRTGTDQARELACALSARLDIPAVACLVRRRGKQKEQKTLSPKERMKNARSAFEVKRNRRIVGKSVLLVDDIVTTGASMAAGVQKLLRAGAERVYCIAVSTDDSNKTPSAPQLLKSEKFASLR